MIPLTPRFSRPNHFVFIFGVVCLTIVLAGVIFVAARSDDGEWPATRDVPTVAMSSPTKAKIAERFGELSLSFEINEGQTDPAVKFLSHGPGYELFLTANAAVLSLRKQAAPDAKTREGSVLRLDMIGAGAAPQIEGQDELPGKINYFIGNNLENWRRSIPTYRKVRYKDVYPGIDVVYYGNQRELEYDFVVAPGANPKLIKFRVEGAKQLHLDQQGNLLIALKHGEVRLNRPFIYQLTDTRNQREVKGRYVIKGSEIRLDVRDVDSSKPLVIDPVLSYSTYLGGNGDDEAFGIAVDAQGSAYVTGRTNSIGFPTTPGAFKANSLVGAFVTKLDPTGSTLVYSTFLSGHDPSQVTIGSLFTVSNAIAVDSSGNAYITGVTTDPDFPVVNPLKTSKTFFKTTDAAQSWNNNNTGLTEELNAIAVSPTNSNIIYAGTGRGVYRTTDAGASWTKTSGFEFTSISAIAVDPTNSSIAYAGAFGLFKTTDGGNTWNPVNIPGSGSIQTIVFDPVTPSTMYVGSGGVFRSMDSGSTWTALNNLSAAVASLAIDPTAPATIYAGTQGGGLFKTTNGGSSWTPINNGITSGSGTNPGVIKDVVIDPLNSSTLYINVAFSRINKSTNGGNSWALVNNSAVAGGVNALVATSSAVYAGTVFGGVIKSIDGGTSWTSANTGLWSGTIRALVVDPSNPAILYAGGSAVSSISDAFVSKLNSSGSDLLFSTYLGGSFGDAGNGIAVDGSGNIYVAGDTRSTNFPTLNAFQSTPKPNETGGNAFVTKLNPSVPSYVFSTYLGGSAKDEANSIAIDPATNVYVTGNTVSADFPLANAFQSTQGDPFAGDAFVTKLNSNGSLSYSTYLGGSNTDNGFGIAVDVPGNAYVTGATRSADFPVANPIQTANDLSTGTTDAFVTKLNSQGSALVYSTFLGGSNSDTARGIAVDPTGSAYVTGFTSSLNFPLIAGALRTRSSMFKSTNAAASWSNDNYGLPFAVTHLVVHPTQPLTLYAGTGNGVFRSPDGGKTWSPINNGLNTPFVMGLVIDPLTPSTLYVAALGVGSGSSAGVYKSTDGGNSWQLRNNGLLSTNVQSLAIDPVTPTTLYAGAGDRNLISKTTDGADNWAAAGVPPAVPRSIAVDPHSPTRIFAAGAFGPLDARGVLRSVDSGAAWQTVLSQSPNDGLWVGVSPHTPGLVYATINSVGFFKSVDGGDNWTFVRPGFGKVVFDPVSASTVYLLSNTEGLLKSTDNGQTLIPMNNGLPVKNTVDLAINPLKTSTLFLATASTQDEDAFVTKINPAGSALTYSTLVGGTQAPGDSLNMNDEALAIAVDSSGNAYITGLARSPDFPTTPNAFQSVNLGGFADTFISKLTMSFIISGHVFDGGGAPVSGAEVVLSDGGSLTAVVTDADGAYEFSHLREGGNFTVSASKPHFTMAPVSQSFNNLTSNQTLNFTATATGAPFFTISGQITDNGAGLASVTVTLTGSQSGIRTTDNNGNYSFEVPGGGNYVVTPSATAFTFDPPSQTLNNLAGPQTANFVATRQSFVVTNTNNHGAGSLRGAIIAANDSAGADTIVFNIPGPGVKVITPLTSLPEITDSVVIDASTQPGYAGAPLIEIDGDNIGFQDGLVITAGNSTVRGLAIGRFASNGIVLRSCNNNVIQGNYIGVDATGNVQRPNGGSGILLSESSNNVIGGTSAAARNVISRSNDGIAIFGSGNVVQGNFIGTNAAGTTAFVNNTGVHVFNTSNNLIGGNSAGAGNLISGNATGISINGPENTVQGNLIGTDVTGTKTLSNGSGILAGGANLLIGGLSPASRNVISGNSTGVVIAGEGSKLQGNFIGTDITGTLALGNNFDGVIAGDGALIGGTVSGARNVIAGNGQSNISLGFNGSIPGVTVQGNYIGTDVTGNRAISAFTVSSGIAVAGLNNLIGGLVPEAQNVISGNAVGIQFRSANVGSPQENVVQGNLIGLNAAGTAPLPNIQGGIEFRDGSKNVVGGTQSGAANKIAFNRLFGVAVTTSAFQNSIRGNSVFSNDGLGIDLGAVGVTANDATDSDGGANNLQNFPVLTSVTTAGNSTAIQGSLNSTPNKTFQIDFYSSAALDPSGYGEGALFFNTTSITTNSNGDATINVTFPMSLGVGRVITATATDPDGDTSEFSAGDVTAAAGNVQFNVSSVQVIEDLGLLTLTVVRKGGSAGSLSIDYATIDGTAIAGQDYTATSGTLNFNNGETSKSIQIPILDDAVTEPAENFTVVLHNGPSLESLGVPNTLTVTVQDHSTVPVISMSSPAIVEGNTGSTTELSFAFILSAQTGRLVSANYATTNLSAFGSASCGNQGTDYEAISGTLTFQPGNTSVTIPVKICGDASAEANEQFRIDLSNLSNAIKDFVPATGTIIDDDELELLLEELGPAVDRAAAVDALLFLREPLRTQIPEWYPPTPDRDARLMFFVRGLQLNPGELPFSVIVELRGNSSGLLSIALAQDVRPVPNVDFAQVIIRVSNALPPDTYTVTVTAHSRKSNAGTIRIAP